MGSAGNPPRLRLVDPDAEQKARRATWLELFGDLVFLAVLAILHLCSDRPGKAMPRLVGAALCAAAAMLAGANGSLGLLGILAAVVAAQVGLELVKKARLA